MICGPYVYASVVQLLMISCFHKVNSCKQKNLGNDIGLVLMVKNIANGADISPSLLYKLQKLTGILESFPWKDGENKFKPTIGYYHCLPDAIPTFPVAVLKPGASAMYWSL